MIRTIIKKEILEQFISVRFIVLTIICLSILPMSLFVGHHEYIKRTNDYNRSLKLNRENIEKVKYSQLFTGDFAVKGYRPPSPLSVFASGLGDAMPQKLIAKKSGTTLAGTNSQNKTILNVTGKIDFSYIIMLVFSLISILFTFDSICGEKEKGTLSAALSNSVPRDKYILGKYFGTLITLVIPLILAAIIGMIILIISGFPLIGSENITRIILIFFSSIFLISIFCCIGLFISSKVDNSKTSIVILISIWIFLLFVIPKGSNIVAKAIVPVDSEEVVQLQKELVRQNLGLEKGRRIAEAKKTFSKVDYSTLSDEEASEIQEKRNTVLVPIREEFAQKTDDEIQKIENRYLSKKASENSIALFIARISPTTAFNQIVTNLAWTGEHNRRRFKESARAYQTVIDQTIFNHIFRDVNPSGGISMGTTKMINLKEIPVFSFERAKFVDTMKAVLTDVLFLIFFSIIIFMLAYVSFLRYDIR